jgi:hypothetical protein
MLLIDLQLFFVTIVILNVTILRYLPNSYLLAFNLMLIYLLDAYQDNDSVSQMSCHNHLGFYLKPNLPGALLHCPNSLLNASRS